MASMEMEDGPDPDPRPVPAWKKRRVRWQSSTKKLFADNQRLQSIIHILEKRSSQAETKARKTAEELKQTRRDPFFASKMAKNAKAARFSTMGVRKKEDAVSATGVEVVVVIPNAVDERLLKGLQGEITTAWRDMKHDKVIDTINDLEELKSCRQQGRDNCRGTKGPPHLVSQPRSHACHRWVLLERASPPSS